MSAPLSAGGERAPGIFATLLTRVGFGAGDETDLARQRDRLAKQLAAASAAHDKLRRRLTDEQNDAGLGYQDAEKRAAELQPQVESAAAEMAALAKDLAAVNGKIVGRERERQIEKAAQQPHEVARRAREHLDHTANVEERGKGFAEAVRAWMQSGAKLNEVLPAPTGALTPKALDERLRHTLRGYFAITPTMPPNLPLEHRSPPYVVLIPASAVNPASPLCKMTLLDAEQAVLENLVHLFETRAQAEAARRRRDPAGGSLHVRARADGLFELVQGSLRGAAKDAAGTEGTP